MNWVGIILACFISHKGTIWQFGINSIDVVVFLNCYKFYCKRFPSYKVYPILKLSSNKCAFLIPKKNINSYSKTIYGIVTASNIASFKSLAKCDMSTTESTIC